MKECFSLGYTNEEFGQWLWDLVDKNNIGRHYVFSFKYSSIEDNEKCVKPISYREDPKNFDIVPLLENYGGDAIKDVGDAEHELEIDNDLNEDVYYGNSNGSIYDDMGKDYEMEKQNIQDLQLRRSVMIVDLCA